MFQWFELLKKKAIYFYIYPRNWCKFVSLYVFLLLMIIVVNNNVHTCLLMI